MRVGRLAGAYASEQAMAARPGADSWNCMTNCMTSPVRLAVNGVHYAVQEVQECSLNRGVLDVTTFADAGPVFVSGSQSVDLTLVFQDEPGATDALLAGLYGEAAVVLHMHGEEKRLMVSSLSVRPEPGGLVRADISARVATDETVHPVLFSGAYAASLAAASARPTPQAVRQAREPQEPPLPEAVSRAVRAIDLERKV